MKTSKNLTEKLPDWALFFGSLIVSQPPRGDWICEKIVFCRSPDYLFEHGQRYDSDKIRFVPVDRKPYLTASIHLGERQHEAYLVFRNIGTDVEKLEREFKERCGL